MCLGGLFGGSGFITFLRISLLETGYKRPGQRTVCSQVPVDWAEGESTELEQRTSRRSVIIGKELWLSPDSRFALSYRSTPTPIMSEAFV
jgi:hypothetical protein